MKLPIIASAIALAMASTAFAASGEKLAQAECDALWMKAGPTDGKLSESAASAYVTDFKAANPDGDTTLEQDEFRNACNQGMIKSTAATGAGEGTSGMDDAGSTSDRTPGKSTETPLQQKDSVGGDTSDRTPKN
jgi:hypothetical protein